MFAAPLSFDGRIGRLEYLLTLLIVLAAILAFLYYKIVYSSSFAVSYSEMIHNRNTHDMDVKNVLDSLALVIFIPLAVWFEMAQAIKRCHDIGHSGCLLLIPLMPIIILFMKGDEQDNEYSIQSNNENEVAANIGNKSGTMSSSFVRFYLCLMMLLASGRMAVADTWWEYIGREDSEWTIIMTLKMLFESLYLIGILLLFHYRKIGFYFVLSGGLYIIIIFNVYLKSTINGFEIMPMTTIYKFIVKMLYLFGLIFLYNILKETDEWEKLESGLKGINWKSILTYLLILEFARYIAVKLFIGLQIYPVTSLT